MHTLAIRSSIPRILRIEAPRFPDMPPEQPETGYTRVVELEPMLDNKNDHRLRSLRVIFITSLRPATLLSRSGNEQGYELTHDYFISGRGKSYPVRGNGPPWENNSCAFDCCLVAARLLKVGSINADFGASSKTAWFESLDTFHREFVQALDHDWDTSSRSINVRKRNETLDSYVFAFNRNAEHPSDRISLGSFQSAVHLWTFCTSMACQFVLKTRRVSWCAVCGAGRSLTSFIPQTAVDVEGTLEDAEQGRSMEQILQRQFGPMVSRNPPKLHDCGATSRSRRRNEIQGYLPVRLVLTPQQHYRNIRNATADRITFTYLSSVRREQEVTYRWLGGIYNRNQHYRLYWTDTAYQHPSGLIKVYDGMAAAGTIIGGIPPDHPDDKIPDFWADGTSLLFYERVDPDTPTQADDAAAAAAAYSIPNTTPSTPVPKTEDARRVLRSGRGVIDLDGIDGSKPSAPKPLAGTKREAPIEVEEDVQRSNDSHRILRPRRK